MEKDNARLEQEMRRLQMSNAYSMADQQNRAKMEAQLIAMKEGYLPADMAQSLIGVPQYNAEQSQGNGSDLSGALGSLGGAAGSVGGFMANQKLGSAISGAGSKVAGMGNIGDPISRQLQASANGLRTDSINLANKMSSKTSNKIFAKLLGGGAQGANFAASGMEGIAGKVAGQGSTKAAAGILGKIGGGVSAKLGGKIVGGLVGGIPGFLIGTAIGGAIEKLMEGDEKDKAKAEFMLSQYR